MFRYVKIDINVFFFIVSFREIIVFLFKVDMVNEVILEQRQVVKKDFEDEEVIELGLVEVFIINGRCIFRIRVVFFLEDVIKFLEENQSLIKIMGQILKFQCKGREGVEEIQQIVVVVINEFKIQFIKVFKDSGKMWIGVENQMWLFGLKRVGSNILFNRVNQYDRFNVWNCVEIKQQELKQRQYDNSIISGF